MAYSSKAIANLLIDTAAENGCQLDQMKLQKLVYIMHGWNLAITGNPLISDDIQAWQYGPVIPDLYDEFKNCGRSPILDHATEFNFNEEELDFTFTAPQVKRDDAYTRSLAQKIWAKYGGLSGPQLSNLTHLPNTPWDKVYNPSVKEVINDNLIKEHFVELSQQK